MKIETLLCLNLICNFIVTMFSLIVVLLIRHDNLKDRKVNDLVIRDTYKRLNNFIEEQKETLRKFKNKYRLD